MGWLDMECRGGKVCALVRGCMVHIQCREPSSGGMGGRCWQCDSSSSRNSGGREARGVARILVIVQQQQQQQR